MSRTIIIIILFTFCNCSKSGHKNRNQPEKIDSPIEQLSSIYTEKHFEVEVETKDLENKIELPFISESGVKIVRIKVNDVPLDFIFDTGASLISISETEARFLVKQGTLTEEDFLGIQPFEDANGNISEGLLVNLKEIDIQGFKIKNVKASIVQNNQAPLLLGQSLLEKFAQITIDNTNDKIILE